jgi:hypothetical protein
VRASVSDAALLAIPAHLTGRDRYLVRLIGEHRVLTTSQLTAVGFNSEITARHRLAVLTGLGLIRRFRPHRDIGSAPWHYLLGPAGAAVLAAEDGDESRWAGQVRADRQLALQTSQRLGHQVGANGFFVALAAHGRRGGGQLHRWGSETDAAEYLHGPRALIDAYRADGTARPDGLGIWADEGGEVVFVLEYDTGSEHGPQLAAKLAGYTALARTPGAVVVPIVFCFPSPRRDLHARRALAAAPGATQLPVATAACDPARTCPAGPIWRPLHGSQAPVRLTALAALTPSIPPAGTGTSPLAGDGWWATPDDADDDFDVPGDCDDPYGP